mgnify:CR=1 FL=1
MKSSVIIFPGSNCDRDMDVALKKYGFKNHMVWHNDLELPKSDLVVLPGGFSYGDYLRCGSIAGKSKIIKSVIDFANSGGLVLGICNGFQILTETGLLPGILLRNASLKYICKDVYLKVNTNETIFTCHYAKGQVIRIPIAHHDGNYFADEDTLKLLEDTNRIAFTYCDKSGFASNDANPNGSKRGIAGVYNISRTILGMMPHPERLADWQLGGTDGQLMFEGLATALL